MFSLTHVVYIGKNRYFCRRQNLKIIPMKNNMPTKNTVGAMADAASRGMEKPARTLH